jgi:predicted DNA-binding protein
MMARMQISLPPEEHRRVRERAAELGVSAAEYVRRLVARDLGAAPAGDITAIFDLGRSGGSDVARHKDRYVAEAIEQAN